MLIIQPIVNISEMNFQIMSSIIKLRGKGVSRIINSKVMLSPLAGVTDKIFRKLVRKWAPESLLFTEMINATSLKPVSYTHLTLPTTPYV